MAALKAEISGVQAATVRPAEFWALALGLPILAIALSLAFIGGSQNVPETDWLRSHLDLAGAVVVGVSVVLQAVVTILDEWGVNRGKFRSVVSVLTIWTGFVGAALVITSILRS